MPALNFYDHNIEEAEDEYRRQQGIYPYDGTVEGCGN